MIRKVIPIALMLGLTFLWPGLSPCQDEEHGIFFLAEKNLYDAHIILGLKKEINLSQQQERKVEKAMLTLQETAIRIGAEIKIEELRLVSYLNSGKTDRQETARRIREIGKKKTDLIVDYMNHLLDLKEILTEKQLQILQEIKEKKKNEIREPLKEKAKDVKKPSI